MDAGSRRWVEVTPSEYAHERAGLAAIRATLDDDDSATLQITSPQVRTKSTSFTVCNLEES